MYPDRQQAKTKKKKANNQPSNGNYAHTRIKNIAVVVIIIIIIHVVMLEGLKEPGLKAFVGWENELILDRSSS
jgi:hypothetical protein